MGLMKYTLCSRSSVLFLCLCEFFLNWEFSNLSTWHWPVGARWPLTLLWPLQTTASKWHHVHLASSQSFNDAWKHSTVSPFAVEQVRQPQATSPGGSRYFSVCGSGTGNDKDTEAIASGLAELRVLSFGGRFWIEKPAAELRMPHSEGEIRAAAQTESAESAAVEWVQVQSHDWSVFLYVCLPFHFLWNSQSICGLFKSQNIFLSLF